MLQRGFPVTPSSRSGEEQGPKGKNEEKDKIKKRRQEVTQRPWIKYLVG